MTSRHGDRRALILLLATSALLLLLGLGARELWGPETRWANIAMQMLQSGDYFDPYLKGSPYYVPNREVPDPREAPLTEQGEEFVGADVIAGLELRTHG